MSDTAIRVESVAIEYGQDADSWSSGGDQLLKVEAVNAGGGHYLVIETERWAIDETGIEAFAAKLRDVLAMAQREA